MTRRSISKKRFVVMPSQGISGPIMQAAIFQPGNADALTDTLSKQLSQFSSSMLSITTLSGPTAEAKFASVIDQKDFEVISQRFSDGVATVAMTQAARLAFEVIHPGLRVLPVTRYYLPGERLRRTPKGAEAASQPSAESAMGTDGRVFVDDLKQHLLGEHGRSARPGRVRRRRRYWR